MKKILITGGPVHAYLDAVKIITNRFKGGLMCQLAEALLKFDTRIFYLCAPSVGAQLPQSLQGDRMHILKHKGFEDYKRQVLSIAPNMDGVVLGAAVANLIPVQPWAGKFPSHNFKPGEEVPPIRFKIAERVIDEVKKVAPHTHLFGYKLLSGVSQEELIRAAYDIVLEARASAVFANDEKKGLLQKYAVTKERGVHPLQQSDLASWIWEMLNDEYYSTALSLDTGQGAAQRVRVRELIERYGNRFTRTEAGLIFGTVAIRCGEGFVTTGRGKRELDSIVVVIGVNHTNRVVNAVGGKASLNAPLLSRMFDNPAVETIVHYHEQVSGLPTYRYAPPGSVRDTERSNATSYNIKEHGCMLLFDKTGRQL